MKPKAKTPVAVFVYNRPDHAQITLSSLAACRRIEECDVFIFSDGPRSADQEIQVNQVRSLCRDWSEKHHACLIEQSENKGLARSIVGGVSRMCEEYGRVIVIEDDLILHHEFIQYMLTALDDYENEEKIAQISGYMFPVDLPSEPRAFLLPFTSTWGWATWQRVWKDVNWEAKDSRELLKDSKLRRRFDLGGTYPYSQMLLDKLQGKNQSWGILFYWWVFSRNYLVLFPAVTLVINGGMDGSGFHTPQEKNGILTLKKMGESQIVANNKLDNKTKFPQMHLTKHSSLVVNEFAYKKIATFLDQYNQKFINKAIRRIKRWLS